MAIMIVFSAPYEGETTEQVSSYQEAQDWLDANQARYNFDHDNVRMYVVKEFETFDLPNLIKGTEI